VDWGLKELLGHETSFMNDDDPSFVDTNILVYAFAGDDVKKSSCAQELIKTLAEANTLHISIQVLQELYNTLIMKNRIRWTPEVAMGYLRIIEEWPVVEINPVMVRASAELSAETKISFWDALIVVAAKKLKAKRLYTEDLSHGQKILGVEVVNPFLSC